MSRSGRDHFEVVIEEDEVLALGRGDAGVDARREVEQAKALERPRGGACPGGAAARRIEQRCGERLPLRTRRTRSVAIV